MSFEFFTRDFPVKKIKWKKFLETKNLKKCDLDLNKWGGYIKGGIYDEYNGIPPCGIIVLEGNFSLQTYIKLLNFERQTNISNSFNLLKIF